MNPIRDQEEAWLSETKRARCPASPSDPVSRRKFLALTGGSTALAAFLAACGDDDSGTTTTTSTGGGTGEAGTEKFGKGDVGILNYALTLEYLETAFYADVVKSGLFKGSDLATIRKFGDEEAEHVEALTGFVKKLRRQAGAEAEDRIPAEERQVGARTGGDGREPRRRRLPGPGAEHQEPLGARRGALDPQRRGPPRGGAQHPAGQVDHARRRRSPNRPTRPTVLKSVEPFIVG